MQDGEETVSSDVGFLTEMLNEIMAACHGGSGPPPNVTCQSLDGTLTGVPALHSAVCSATGADVFNRMIEEFAFPTVVTGPFGCTIEGFLETGPGSCASAVDYVNGAVRAYVDGVFVGCQKDEIKSVIKLNM